MFILHVFIMFAYEMSSSYSSSEAGFMIKKLRLSVELTIPIHLRRTQLTTTPLMWETGFVFKVKLIQLCIK